MTRALGTAGIWRHASVLPSVAPEHRITLGEGSTPIVADAALGCRYKLEFLSVTGSFKDRGASVLTSCLLQRGVAHAVLDSSGNAGAAMAAYLARAGIAATVFAPAHASPAKLRQIAAYGAQLELVAGDRDAATRAARDHARDVGATYASHLVEPAFVAGMRTFALECLDPPAVPLPDAIVFPVGSGSLLLGCFEGFRAMREAGAVDRIPRIVGVQAEACAPLVEAFEEGRDEVAHAAGTGVSMAEGIMVADPPGAPAVLAAVRATDGALLRVTESEIAAASLALAARGLFVEPTSAVAEAGRRRLLETGRLDGDADVLVALTGSGLKTAGQEPMEPHRLLGAPA
jgi:threonine synthase